MVSVIVPTRGRPQLVGRAVKSVLAQSFVDFELIVVIDGLDPDTVTSLAAFADDSRLRILINEVSLGPGGARNKGVDYARGEWIAFLDDDDEWLKEKLSLQMADALLSNRNCTIFSCLSTVKSPNGIYVWPRIIYDNYQRFDEYLFDRTSPFIGESFVPTPSLLLSRSLCLKYRFPENRHHEDWDFLLRLMFEGKCNLITIPVELVIIYYEEDRKSLSSSATWKESLLWVDNLQISISRRAYSGFCLTVAGAEAADKGGILSFIFLMYRAFWFGRPRGVQLWAFVSYWLLPSGIRRKLRKHIQVLLSGAQRYV